MSTRQQFIPSVFTILMVCVISIYGQNWKLIWSDEFDYSGLPESTKWSFDTAGNEWDWGNNEDQNYTPPEKNNAWVENGTLIIEARKEKWTYPGDGQERDYTSARMRTITNGDWTFARIEVRAKLPGGKGTWPAIWMLPTDNEYGEWPKSGELDIMENIGAEPDRIYCTVWNESNQDNWGDGSYITLNDIYDTFHVYIMEWLADSIRFFVDSTFVYAFPNDGLNDYKTWPYDKRFHLLMNIAIGGDWGGEIDTTIFPVRMCVDYVRVYEDDTPIVKSIPQSKYKFSVNVKQKDGFGIPLISYAIPYSSHVEAGLYNCKGVLVKKLESKFREQGIYLISTFHLKKLLSTGAYYFRIRTDYDNNTMIVPLIN